MLGYRYSLVRSLCLLAMTAFILDGCIKVGPNFKPEPAPQTQQYTNKPLPKKTVRTPQAKNAGKSQQFVMGRDLPSDWWQIFHSQQLNTLITDSLADNQNLVAAKAALEQANDTLYAEAGGLLLPAVNFQGLAERVQTNPIQAGVQNQGTTLFSVYNASFQASYVLDIWGASRRQVEAYAAQADYQRYEMLATYLTMTTNIATTAFTIASLEAQIKATKNLIAEQQQVLTMTQKQLAVGGASVENVLSQQTLLAQTQATLPPLQTSLSQEQHALAVLVGKPTSDIPTLQLNLNHITLPKNLPVSLPSKMLEQRPDIQASQALLHQASAQIGVATANLLPQITITGGYGWLAPSLNNFFSNQNQVWSIAGGLMQPIFHGGQLIFQRKAAIAAFDQAKAQYKQTVLQAFKNVADALRAIQYDAYLFNELYRAKKSAYQTYYLTLKQFNVGGQNYLSVLQAEEQYQHAVISCVKAQAQRYSDTAALYQALGGGWWNNNISQYGLMAHRRFLANEN